MPSESSAQTAAPSWRAIGLSDGMNLPRHSGLATEILRISNEIDGPLFAPGETNGGVVAAVRAGGRGWSVWTTGSNLNSEQQSQQCLRLMSNLQRPNGLCTVDMNCVRPGS